MALRLKSTGRDASPSEETVSTTGDRDRTGGFSSPLTRRILSVNMLALAILGAGILYLNRFEDNLIATELQGLQSQGEIFAGALGQGAWRNRPDGASELSPVVAGPMLRRLVTVTGVRGRLFGPDGKLLADSRNMVGTAGGAVDVIALPPPAEPDALSRFGLGLYDRVVSWLPGRRHLPRYAEPVDQERGGYPEVRDALGGDPALRLRIDAHGQLVLSAAVPVQRFKKILGVIMISETGERIDRVVREVRLDILKVFAAALAVTILLSLYLGRTIVRPLRRLAQAADQVRAAPGAARLVHEFQNRNDEIGDLAADLNAMTEALSQRLDAIESFAADVSHEIKNPLTSLQSAVETAARVKDPDQQQRLMEIIQDDVRRLDRLITDISAASRLDAELSREERSRLDLGRLLAALVQIHDAGAGEKHATPVFRAATPGTVHVVGEEGRLIQVFQNLLTNAFSFSPVDGQVAVIISVLQGWVTVSVEDSGPGIPEGSQEKIFERFYSERPDSEQFGTHSGLGLSISKQIVEAHGGTIFAENIPGRGDKPAGARFIVRLPRA